MKLTAFFLLATFCSAQNFCNQDEYCRHCEKTGCILCMASFKNTLNNICEPVSEAVNNCRSYSADGVCSLCNWGFRPDEKGQCVAITEPANCARVRTGSNDCEVCNESIREVGNQCNPANKCTIDNCRYCHNFDGLEQCAVCSEKFIPYTNIFNRSQCLPRDDSNRFCDALLFNIITRQNQCAFCSYGYFDSDAGCVKSSKVNAFERYTGYARGLLNKMAEVM